MYKMFAAKRDSGGKCCDPSSFRAIGENGPYKKYWFGRSRIKHYNADFPVAAWHGDARSSKFGARASELGARASELSSRAADCGPGGASCGPGGASCWVAAWT